MLRFVCKKYVIWSIQARGWNGSVGRARLPTKQSPFASAGSSQDLSGTHSPENKKVPSASVKFLHTLKTKKVCVLGATPIRLQSGHGSTLQTTDYRPDKTVSVMTTRGSVSTQYHQPKHQCYSSMHAILTPRKRRRILPCVAQASSLDHGIRCRAQLKAGGKGKVYGI